MKECLKNFGKVLNVISNNFGKCKDSKKKNYKKFLC